MRPRFTATVVLTLATGMAMSTTMYSFVHGVLIQPLPFRDQERIVTGWKTDARAEAPLVELSYAEYADWRAQSTSFEELAAMPTTVYGYGYVLTGYGDPVQVESARVSGNFFRVLGVEARLGRTFTDRDEFVGAPPVVVISSHLWRERFRSDPAIVGSAIRLNGIAHVVLGVMPDGFEFPRGADIWSPLGTNRQWVENRGAVFLQTIGRLKPGVSRLRAEGEVAAVAARVAAQHPEAGPASQSVKLTPIAEYIAGNSRPALYLLLAAALFLLAMSAINVASLWLVHVSERQPETSVRAALGAAEAASLGNFSPRPWSLLFSRQSWEPCWRISPWSRSSTLRRRTFRVWTRCASICRYCAFPRCCRYWRRPCSALCRRWRLHEWN